MTENQLISKLLNKVKKSPLKNHSDLIFKACKVAKKAHQWQSRKSKDVPFLTHPIEVAEMLLERYWDLPLTIAWILHDTVEDSSLTIAEVYKNFGEEIGFIVDSLNKHEQSFYKYPDKIFNDKIERLLWAGKQDIRCLLVKIWDRENNLETLWSLKWPKQKRMAFESQAIFLPLKSLLNFERPQTVEKTGVDYLEFLKNNWLLKESEFKNFLIKKSFDNIDNDLFGLIYSQCAEVIWLIEDREKFAEFLENESFNNSVEIVQLESFIDSFKGEFRFKKWCLPCDNRNKFNLSPTNLTLNEK